MCAVRRIARGSICGCRRAGTPLQPTATAGRRVCRAPRTGLLARQLSLAGSSTLKRPIHPTPRPSALWRVRGPGMAERGTRTRGGGDSIRESRDLRVLGHPARDLPSHVRPQFECCDRGAPCAITAGCKPTLDASSHGDLCESVCIRGRGGLAGRCCGDRGASCAVSAGCRFCGGRL